MTDAIQIDLNQPFERVAANGPHVKTVLGRVPVAPPAAELPKAKPFNAASQGDLAAEAPVRVVAGPNHSVSKQPTEELINND